MSSIASRIREIVSISVRLFVRETRNACLISPRKFVATFYYAPHICLINHVAKYRIIRDKRCLRFSELVKITCIPVSLVGRFSRARAEIVFLFSFRHFIVFRALAEVRRRHFLSIFCNVRICTLFRKLFGIMPIFGN